MELYSIKEAIESISRELSSRERAIENIVGPLEKFSRSRKRTEVIIPLYFLELKVQKEKYSKLLDDYVEGFIIPNYKKMSARENSTVIGSKLKNPVVTELESTMEDLLKVKP